MVNIFLNDSYKLLKLLYDNQTVILDKTVVPLTQVEISKALDMSKAKVNVLFKILQDEGYISQESRGKYVLLDRGLLIIDDMNKLESKLSQLKKDV